MTVYLFCNFVWRVVFGGRSRRFILGKLIGITDVLKEVGTWVGGMFLAERDIRGICHRTCLPNTCLTPRLRRSNVQRSLDNSPFTTFAPVHQKSACCDGHEEGVCVGVGVCVLRSMLLHFYHKIYCHGSTCFCLLFAFPITSSHFRSRRL